MDDDMYTKALVTAQQFNSATGEVEGPQRVEEVDLVNNTLFNGTCGDKAQTAFAVHRQYEAFWNDLEDYPASMVLVSAITMVEGGLDNG